jgi:hypothetical protein
MMSVYRRLGEERMERLRHPLYKELRWMGSIYCYPVAEPPTWFAQSPE